MTAGSTTIFWEKHVTASGSCGSQRVKLGSQCLCTFLVRIAYVGWQSNNVTSVTKQLYAFVLQELIKSATRKTN